MLAEGRITDLEINKDVRVHTAWDLGLSDSTAIWFVRCVGRERRLVDYYEASGVGLNHYVQVLNEKRIAGGYKYGEHYFPHDIVHREFTSGKSRRDALAGMGIERQLSYSLTSLMASTLSGGCSAAPGSTVLDVNEVSRLYERIGVSGAKTSRIGSRHPSTIGLLRELMRCELSLADLTTS